MTVRVVVTAGGQFHFGGAGYTPEGEVTPDSTNRGIEGGLRKELERALAVADRADNAVLTERDGNRAVQGDPTEGALLVAARKSGLHSEELANRFPRVGEVPFSSERKLMSANLCPAPPTSVLHSSAQPEGLARLRPRRQFGFVGAGDDEDYGPASPTELATFTCIPWKAEVAR